MLGITWDEFIGMGRNNPEDHSERFCMSVFACNTCQEVNGVSKLHGWVSQRMFAPIWKGYYPEESHVGYVTNGVHFPTWTATEWRKVYASISTRTTFTTRATRACGTLSTMCLMQKSGRHVWHSRRSSSTISARSSLLHG